MQATTPNWKPLTGRLERTNRAELAKWMWMYSDNGLEFYKHIDTRRYLILDADGKAWDPHRRGPGQWIDFDLAYAHATTY